MKEGIKSEELLKAKKNHINAKCLNIVSLWNVHNQWLPFDQEIHPNSFISMLQRHHQLLYIQLSDTSHNLHQVFFDCGVLQHQQSFCRSTKSNVPFRLNMNKKENWQNRAQATTALWKEPPSPSPYRLQMNTSRCCWVTAAAFKPPKRWNNSSQVSRASMIKADGVSQYILCVFSLYVQTYQANDKKPQREGKYK